MKSALLLLFISIVLLTPAQEKDPYKKIVDSLSKSGQTKQLISFFEKELKKKPKDENVLRYLGGIYLSEENTEKADYYYTQALQLNPACARCYLKLGLSARIKKNDAQASGYYEKAIQLDPKQAEFYIYRAKLRESGRDKFRALSDYNKAIELDPKNEYYYLERSSYNIKSGYAALALGDINKAIEVAPENYVPYREKAEFFYSKGMMPEAEQAINKAIATDSSQAALYSARGAIYSSQKKFDLAFKDYEKNMRLEPSVYLPYYNRSLDKYALEDMDGSCEDLFISYKLYKAQDPTSTFIQHMEAEMSDHCDSSRASYYYQRGIANFNLGRYEKAVAIYTKGLQKFPGNTLALQFRGNARYAMGDYANALLDFYAAISDRENLKAAVRNNPRFSNASEDSVALYIRGFTCSTQLSIAECKFGSGDYSAALTEINKALDNFPAIKDLGKETYYNVRGTIYLALARYADALSDFNRCLAFDPNFYLAYVNRAIAKAYLSENSKLKTTRLEGGINNKNLIVKWDLPVQRSSKKSEANLSAALDDCNKAIDFDADFSFAYYVRGHIKKMLEHGDFCFDLLKAQLLGYPVEEEVLNLCGKNK